MDFDLDLTVYIREPKLGAKAHRLLAVGEFEAARSAKAERIFGGADSIPLDGAGAQQVRWLFFKLWCLTIRLHGVYLLTAMACTTSQAAV